MSPTPQLKCLFCNHLNPGGASFCNECGSPLNLQPCAGCGAIDKRTAKACHKCSEVFSPLASLDLAPPEASKEIQAENKIQSESEKDGSHPAIAPTILYDQRALSATNYADVASERTALAESAIGMFSEFSQGFRPESKERLVNEVVTEVPETRRRKDDPEHISGGLQQHEETVTNRRAPKSTGTRLLWVVVGSLALLAAMAGSVYYYNGQSTLLAENQDMNQLAPPPARIATIADPLPASEDVMKPVQEPPIIKQCPEAITALGLCSPDTKQE